jgi:hypothetical protein
MITVSALDYDHAKLRLEYDYIVVSQMEADQNLAPRETNEVLT